MDVRHSTILEESDSKQLRSFSSKWLYLGSLHPRITRIVLSVFTFQKIAWMGVSFLFDPALLKVLQRENSKFCEQQADVHFAYIILFNSQPWALGLISPISQMEKLRLREAGGLLSSAFSLYTVLPFAQGARSTRITEIERCPHLHGTWSQAIWKPPPLMVVLLITQQVV